MRYFPWILLNICYQDIILNFKFNFILVFCSIRFENIMLWWYQYKIANSCVLQKIISSVLLNSILTWDEIKSRKTFPSLILSSTFWYQNNWPYCLVQAIASLFGISVFFAFSNLYATLVCVACSQCEKLRADLLNIRQTLVITEWQPGDESGQQYSERQTHTIEQAIQHMRKQLNECIRHHQDIKRYEHISRMFYLNFFHCSARKKHRFVT